MCGRRRASARSNLARSLNSIICCTPEFPELQRVLGKDGGKAETDPNVTVTSGVLESSNVNAAQSLINMIELQRMYDFQVKSMNSSDQNEQMAEQMMSNAS